MDLWSKLNEPNIVNISLDLGDVGKKALIFSGISAGLVAAYYMGKKRGESLIGPQRTTDEEFKLSEESLRHMMASLEEEMDKGLDQRTCDSSDLKMVQTFVRNLPDGSEHGKILAMDLGGTNFRILEVNISNREHVDIYSKIFLIPSRYMTGEGEDLFDYLAGALAFFVKSRKISRQRDKPIPCGFTFSFPCKQNALDSADLIEWTKGFTCSGVVGSDVVKLMQEAIDKRHDINVHILALVNDTVGTLMTCAHEDPNCRIGVIFGTGTNACYVEDLEKVKKWENAPPGSNQVIINTEWGAFGDHGCLDCIRTPYDEELDYNSCNPGKQKFEKMISGMYLGALVRTIIFDFIERQIIFPGLLCKDQMGIGSAKVASNVVVIPSKTVSDMEHDEGLAFKHTKELLEELGFAPTYHDCHIVQRICELVSDRASKLAAAAVAVLINRVDRPNVTVGVDGSVFRHHRKFKEIMEDTLSNLVRRGCSYRLTLSEDGSGKGAALVAAVVDRVNETDDDEPEPGTM